MTRSRRTSRRRGGAVVAPLLAVGLALLFAPAVAAAQSFGGFAGNEKSYLVGRDRVCAPLVVSGAAARGVPACQAATTDAVARLSVKAPRPERGAAAEVRAAARGRTVTVTRKDGAVVVAWDAPDPVAAIVDVWRSTYGRLVVVEYTVRRGGREVPEVVGFDVGVGGREPRPGGAPGTGGGDGSGAGSGSGSGGGSGAGSGSGADAWTGATASGGGTTPTTAPPPPDPRLTAAVAKARKTSGKAALGAWAQVLALDAEHAEARYRTAAAHLALKRPADAVTALEGLASSSRADAIEWLIEARHDKAFRTLLGHAGFRAAVGLDRAPVSPYERLMGLGGQWEQALVPCDRPELKLTFRRDRTFRLDFRSVCQGRREGFALKGTWRQTETALELLLSRPGGGHDAAPCLLGRDGDEDTLTCHVDADLSFEGRPVRR
ncbi:MAG: hypothetical protein KJZ91_10155 [Myxococcales bacterium]|nr:hypothetical protein [Myxococcales bacterium]